MKKICVFSLYADKGASSQYRIYIYRKKLQEKFDIEWFYFWNNKYVTKYIHNKKKYMIQIMAQYIGAIIVRWFQLNFIAPKADVIFLQKGSIPKLKRHFLDKAKSKGVKIIFDVDDAIYLNVRDNSDDIAKISDVVICGNETLQNHYKMLNKRCIILPTIENTVLYKIYWHDTFKNKTIGWIGSKTTVDNLEMIVNPLNKVIERHPEISFYIISDDDSGYVERIKNAQLIHWDKQTYIEKLSKLSIGIMPLKDNEFNRGKCGFKLIQYLNMKKPVIGSGVGVNTDIIKGNGIIADTEEEWEEAFETLLFDENEYYGYVDHIEKFFLKEYHFDAVSGKLIELLEKI